MTIKTNPLIEDVTIGPAYGAIDCVDLGCLDSVEIRLTMKEHEVVCNILKGLTGIIRYDPRGDMTINPLNLSFANLARALDASVAVTTGVVTATGEVHYPTWVADDPATPTQWTATITMANSEIVSGTVESWDDLACSVSWDDEATNTLTESALCAGTIVLTTTDASEKLAAVYFSYQWGDQIPSGSNVIKPSFSSFAADHKVTLIHQHATSGKFVVYKVWRAQILPDFTITFSNQAREVMAPIRLRVLEDSTNHPSSPLGEFYEIASSNTEYDYAPYTSVPGNTVAT
jgi:hypothetical protein